MMNRMRPREAGLLFDELVYVGATRAKVTANSLEDAELVDDKNGSIMCKGRIVIRRSYDEIKRPARTTVFVSNDGSQEVIISEAILQ